MDISVTVPVTTPKLSTQALRRLKGKTHKCKACDKMFQEAREARAHHERVHIGVTHACKTCKTVFTTLPGLKFHMLQATMAGRSCKDPIQTIFCKICCKSHKNTIQGHEKGIRHQKQAEAAREAASNKTQMFDAQMHLERGNVQKLCTLTGKELRTAMMGDNDIAAESDSEDAWAADGDSSD